MTCEACGEELAGRRCFGTLHRTCAERLLEASKRARGVTDDDAA